MSKWIAIPIIVVLVIALAGGGYFLWLQTDNLTEAEAEIVTLEEEIIVLEGNISTLEGDVTSLEGNVASLEIDLEESEATVVSLEGDLTAANKNISDLQGNLSSQRTLNSQLSGELRTVKDPKHFSTLQELTDWVAQDDTDIKYADDESACICYILQVRALRVGYLLPVSFYAEGGALKFFNMAIIDADKVYAVSPWDDSIIEIGYLYDPIPSHPLPLN